MQSHFGYGKVDGASKFRQFLHLRSYALNLWDEFCFGLR